MATRARVGPRVRVRVTARVREARRFVRRRTCHPGCTPPRRRRRRHRSSRAPPSAPPCAPRAAPRARCRGSLGTAPRLLPNCRRGRRLYQRAPAAPTPHSHREVRGEAPPVKVRSGCGEGAQGVQGCTEVRRGCNGRAERVPRGCRQRVRRGRLLQRAPSLHRGMRQLQRRHGLHSLHAVGLRVTLQMDGRGRGEGGRGGGDSSGAQGLQGMQGLQGLQRAAGWQDLAASSGAGAP